MLIVWRYYVTYVLFIRQGFYIQRKRKEKRNKQEESKKKKERKAPRKELVSFYELHDPICVT
jgi:hypothetical protein